jgi:hypothetical protein
LTARTEIFPPAWVDVLLDKGANFEVTVAANDESSKPLPAYVADGQGRVVRVKCQAQTSPFSRARLIDFKTVEQVA